ncbi:MAG: Ig-like domain-containing protein [Actinomycetota bacterium]
MAVQRYWTPERRATAIPRDFVLDERGLTYIEQLDGSWRPHGHPTPASTSMGTPMAKPGGSTDTTPPSVTNQSPAPDAVVGSSQTFSATVTDASGVKSVTFRITRSDGVSQTFVGSVSGTTWSASINGFTNGSWTWSVIATDTAARGGNTTTTAPRSFSVDTGGGGGGGGGDVVVNQRWTTGGDVLTAAGRIFFEMPANKRQSRWVAYVCSGTVATDGTSGRSIVITAAHCVYDDANKAFARNVMFIPNQDGTTGSGSDRDCSNDPLGCWTASFGVVDVNWSSRTWPNNIPWDYAYYVVDDTSGGNGTLDSAAGSLTVDFTTPDVGTYTHALGYSYSDDPFFMYCAENLDIVDANNWWLGSCGLSGGASGGPWIQPLNTSTGVGPIISVNSWGYSGSPGMAGPVLSGTSASCLFTRAKSASITTANGITVNNC